jgi:hypothetical protein
VILSARRDVLSTTPLKTIEAEITFKKKITLSKKKETKKTSLQD